MTTDTVKNAKMTTKSVVNFVFFETLTTEKSATVQLFGGFCSFKVSRNRQVASFRNSVSFIQLEV